MILKKVNPNNLLPLCLVSLIGVMALAPLMILPMYVLAYRDVLGFDPDIAGWIASSCLAGIAIMTLVVSLKAKSWNLTKVTLYGIGTVLVLNVLMLFFQNQPGTLALLGFVGGLGGGAAQAAVAAALTRTEHPERSFGIYIAWQFALPAIAFYFFARLLFDETGFGGIFVGFNAMLAVIIVLDVLALLIVSVIANYKLLEGDTNDDSIELNIILQKPALLSLIGLMIYGAANAAIWAYAEGIGLLANDDIEWVGDILAYVTAASVLGPILVTMIRDKLGHYGPLTAGIALQILAMYILINNATPNGYIIGMGLFSIAWAFAWPYFLSIQATFDKSGSVVSCGQFTNLVGNSMGPFFAAFYVGTEGDYVGAIWLAAVLFVLALIPMFIIKFIRRGSPSSGVIID